MVAAYSAADEYVYQVTRQGDPRAASTSLSRLRCPRCAAALRRAGG
jgi:hypothetical protein